MIAADNYEIIGWTQAVENFDGSYMQVSAIILKSVDKVEVVNLQEHYRWTEIDILDCNLAELGEMIRGNDQAESNKA